MVKNRVTKVSQGSFLTPVIPNGAILCTVCGCKGGAHRGTDGKCPPIESFGRAKPFPELGPDDGQDHLKRWDERIAAYWPSPGTIYVPRR